MNGLSERLAKAIGFIKESGYERREMGIAEKVGVTYSTLSMTKKGKRVPTWDMLLNLCDNYPIRFEWLRTGKGEMVDRERYLEMEVARLQAELDMLKGRIPQQ